jgi:uncharacterized protein YyaL (SSP411 family)
LLSRFSKNNSTEYFHTWKNDIAKQPAFLDDYAFLIQALVQLQEITGSTDYLEKAIELTEHVIENFGDTKTDFFFYTTMKQEDIVVRKKEVYDGAQPSGNAVMADIMYRLCLYFDKPDWREKTTRKINSVGNAIVRYPTSFGVWANILIELTIGTNKIAILSANSQYILSQVLKEYVPNKIIMAAKGGSNSFPLLSGKGNTDKTALYLCRNYSCEKPVASVAELIALIRHNELKIS